MLSLIRDHNHFILSIFLSKNVNAMFTVDVYNFTQYSITKFNVWRILRLTQQLRNERWQKVALHTVKISQNSPKILNHLLHQVKIIFGSYSFVDGGDGTGYKKTRHSRKWIVIGYAIIHKEINSKYYNYSKICDYLGHFWHSIMCSFFLIYMLLLIWNRHFSGLIKYFKDTSWHFAKYKNFNHFF